MFGSNPEGRNLRVTIVNFGSVRVKDKRQQDPTHLIDVSFEVPFTPEIAAILGDRVLRNSFDEAPKTEEGWIPKPDVDEIKLVMQPGAQILTIRAHPDMPPVATIENVLIRHVKLSKQQKADVWMLSFVNTFPLIPDIVAQVMRFIKAAVYVTYEQQQTDLPFEEGERKPDPSGAGQQMTPRRGRRRRGQAATAEQEPPLQPVDQFADVPASNESDGPSDDQIATGAVTE